MPIRHVHRIGLVVFRMAIVMSGTNSGSTLTTATTAEADRAIHPTGGLPAEERIRKHFLNRGHGGEFEMEAAWIQAFVPSDTGLVLDVGCGNGALFETIGANRVLGVDYCHDGLILTRRRFASVPLFCADACNLPFASSSVDVVVAQHLIEHLPSRDAACREWFRVLKEEGVLLVLTPNASFCDPSVYRDESHIHIFDERGLRAVLEEVGFVVQDVRTLGLPWFRSYHRVPSGWRVRRFVTQNARALSGVAPWRWKGQTLCCAAGKELA